MSKFTSILKFEILVRLLLLLASISIVLYIIYHNVAPFGAFSYVNVIDTSKKINLQPIERIKILASPDNQPIIDLKEDLIYFTTDMNYKFDTAKVSITYKNPYNDQQFELGFQDDRAWHYDTQVVDFPPLNNLAENGNWLIRGENPTLFQKSLIYNSFDELFSSPSIDHPLGIFNFDSNIFRQTSLPNYSPSNSGILIDTPLRGRIVFYTYLSNEPFKLTVTKQDLNLSQDPDIVSIKIFKENDVVYSTIIDDDGISDDSGSVTFPEDKTIENPGPDLPESGVYKVVIDSPQDTIINKIQASFNKIVFDSPLYPVENHTVYKNVIPETKATKLFTDARSISAITNHPESEQQIIIGKNKIPLIPKQEISTSSAETITEINIPLSDVLLTARAGYFAFKPEHFFQPTRLKLQNINNQKDIEDVGVIIANYKLPKIENEWKTSELEFNLTDAVPKKGKLNWMIRAPGIKENGRGIQIKAIAVQLSKKPTF